MPRRLEWRLVEIQSIGGTRYYLENEAGETLSYQGDHGQASCIHFASKDEAEGVRQALHGSKIL